MPLFWDKAYRKAPKTPYAASNAHSDLLSLKDSLMENLKRVMGSVLPHLKHHLFSRICESAVGYHDYAQRLSYSYRY